MKKYALFLIVVVLILGIMFTSNVQAGKPKPTPNPYPNLEFEAQAYPIPDLNIPFPGNPPPNEAYVWGAYKVDGEDVWRWYVSKFTSAPVIDADIFLCTAQENPYYQTCYRHRHDPPLYWSSLEYYGYEDGMSIYRSIPVSPCGWWGAMPDTSDWDGESFELHQPNMYRVPCAVWGENPRHIPLIRKP